MSKVTPRNLAIGAGALVAGIYFFPRTTQQVSGNPFETQAVKNIGDRYSAGGGSNTHAPGVASKRGDNESTASNQERSKGLGTPAFEELHADQKVTAHENGASKAYRRATSGNDNGK